MKTLALVLALFVAPAALSSVVITRTAEIVMIQGSTQVGAPFASEQACDDAVVVKLNQAASGGKTSGKTPYVCRERRTITGTFKPNTPPPTCPPPQPADQTRPGTCPPGTTGTWTQTSTYSCPAGATAWVAGTYQPTTPPAGACVTTPPPPTDTDGDGVPDSSDACPNEYAQTPDGCPAPVGTYPGYTYTLPTVRPFISLNHYASGNATAVARLKGQVDTATSITASQTTYSGLQTALGSCCYGYSSTDSVVMFKLTGDPKYIDQAVHMVDLFVISENQKINAGQRPVIAGDSYLEVGWYMEQVALAYDYGYSRLTSAQRTAWSTYAETVLFNLWNYNQAKWGGVSYPWTGWSIDDPGNNYFYSFLKATQMWALASQNQSWFTFLQTKKYTQLVPFFAKLVGGGSREGTGYGTAMGNLFDDYAFWKESTGEDLGGYSSHARETIDYWIHATVPSFTYFASIGDQSRNAMPLMFDYQRKLVEEAVALYPTSAEGKRGTWWLNRVKVEDGGGGFVLGKMRYNYDFRFDLLSQSATEQAPVNLWYSSPGTGALFARSDWGANASWMHLNVGYYDQSHAHQDQGAFSLYRGKWLSITSNVYSRSGINQDTGVENVLRFDYSGSPVAQRNSVSTKTVNDSGDVLQVNANLSPAYPSNRVSSWTRDFRYERSTHTLSIHDRCAVAAGVVPVWQLHVPVSPVLQSDGSYLASGLRIVPRLPAAGVVKIVNMKNLSSEFTAGYRFEVTDPANGCEFSVDLTAQ